MAIFALAASAVLIGLVWWVLDRRIRGRARYVERARVVRAIAIAPALAGPYRSGGGGAIFVDETAGALAGLRRRRRAIGYVFGVPLALVGIAMLVVTGCLLGPLSELVGEALAEWVGGGGGSRRGS